MQVCSNVISTDSATCWLLIVCILLGLLFDPEEGSDMFFPKRRWTTTDLHGGTTQMIVLFALDNF
jgi:hypothetical protein